MDGVTYINDSKGTNVDATVKAVETMQSETVLLLGGKNKGYDYAPLFTALKRAKIAYAILYGENRYELLKAAREQGFERLGVCTEFTLALQMARIIAKRGQTVLLSPASASFDEFVSYEERGDKFVEIVQAFKREEKRTAETLATADKPVGNEEFGDTE